MQAAIDGASEVGVHDSLMTSLSLAAVFHPVPVHGWHHRQAVPASSPPSPSAWRFSCPASCQQTLTPMLSSRFLKSDHGKKHGRFYEVTEKFYDAWLGVYERTLAWVMARRPLTLVFSTIILFATAYLFWSTPKGLFPAGSIQVSSS